ncbi:MAG: hypothetical protein A3J47_03555 [Candidatus Yanofskybacteria bacterium RIFCSPHIGHO2_02_FULL_43_22]|uniref:NAD-dependent epimerase/dehydratase domain-containing protein n=1 Tax=Candidatus Yanofskybacteria bacterium RIFCSPHIGHO2_02_FULL_43_22 TaxID=1802681 RepID=A0A1F8FQ22_9BACT|nr:MAG: hypothetical protein A3J47_03555 [Candidatus Yanofskybacteria bacterium RIFCSPHIGHO2_02_FULL_43_22]
MRLLVTGGAGFIGSNLVDELVRQGHKVSVIDNLSGGKKENINPKCHFFKKDICNYKSIASLFKNVDYVFHLAALPRVQYSIEHPLETNETNVTGTLNVLKASYEAGVKKVIYSASSSAYGDQKIMPLREDFLANPKSPYGLQKYIGELYCKIWSEVYGLPTVCLRYFNVYGHRQSHEGAYALVIAKFIKQKLSGQPMTITGDGKHTRDFTNVKDVVRANILAMRSRKVGKGEVVNIGAGNNQSILRVARLIGGPIKFISARLEPRDTLADISKAKRLLNWQPRVSLKDWIKKQIVIK